MYQDWHNNIHIRITDVFIIFILYCSLWQYIQQAINKDVNDVEGILNQPDGVDEGVWKYEHLR
jgi:hypothetical protein